MKHEVRSVSAVQQLLGVRVIGRGLRRSGLVVGLRRSGDWSWGLAVLTGIAL